MNIFEEIRHKTRLVAEAAQFITIEYDKLDAYAKALPIEHIANPPLDETCHYLGHNEATLLYFLTLEAINFGSGYFPYLKNSVEGSGYFTVAKAWKVYFEQNKPITAEKLTQLSTQDCLIIFGQSKDNEAIVELMDFFAIALNQVGHFLLEKFKGKVKLMFESVHHSAEGLVNLLIQMPCFQDFATYDDLQVPILKRPQIAVADISLAFGNEGLGYFKDLNQLTIFADNMVPHVLRCDGILTYHTALANIVDKQALVKAGSAMEVEIRACAIHTVELLREKFKAMGHDFTSVDLDYLLWNRGQAAFYETTYPIHLTRTIFY
ncbi:MAG: queuosine salvage family protein [Saprospiraceae bacterium]